MEVRGIMNKTVVALILFCVAFTFWWSWKLDSSFFIYRHEVPESLNKKINETFFPYLKGRDITGIRFGSKSAHQSEKVPIEIVAEETEEWMTSNSRTGPIKLDIDLDNEKTKIYWDIPQDTPMEDANALLAQSLWDVLVQYDDIIKIKNSYE